MIGKEIADAISPIVMWIAIVGGVLTLVFGGAWLIRRRIARSAIKEKERDDLLKAEDSRSDALDGMRKRRRRIRESWRNIWVRDREPERDATAGPGDRDRG